jgi:hypothetical protein
VDGESGAVQVGNWVVIIGIELLSLACLGLGLGSEYGYNIYAYVTLSLLRLF